MPYTFTKQILPIGALADADLRGEARGEAASGAPVVAYVVTATWAGHPTLTAEVIYFPTQNRVGVAVGSVKALAESAGMYNDAQGLDDDLNNYFNRPARWAARKYTGWP